MINRIRKIIREIKIIGIKDWFRFVIILKRNEFHPKLNLKISKFKVIKEKETYVMRKKAHDIDQKIREIDNV